MTKVRTTKRQSKWQFKLAAAQRNLAWAYERAAWMALGVLMGLAIAWAWR